MERANHLAHDFIHVTIEAGLREALSASEEEL